MKPFLEIYAPYFFLFLLFLAALIFRPLLPVDETRYMTVAWEMFLQKQYAVLSLNFDPYHHKPPMLFWMMNMVWEVCGVSRWAALIPVFAAASSVLFLTQSLARRLLCARRSSLLVPWLMLGSVPYLIYGTLVMFDMMVAALLLSALIMLWDYAQKPRFYRVFLAGLLIGAGVLTKGPVMYLYIFWPLVLYAFWRPENFISCPRFYKAVAFALIVSVVPVLLWLAQVLAKTDHDFAFWLLWEQTAGRITGNFSSAHVRPIFFYMLFLPAFFLPWLLFPSFWRHLKILPSTAAFRFLAAATLPVLVSFSFISGKQPHYLLPLLPFIVIGIAILVEDVRPQLIRAISIAMVCLLIGGQALASQMLFPRYDLTDIVAFYQSHRNQDWAFVRNYQGEINFLARAEKPIENIQPEKLRQWFAQHEGGFAIVRYRPSDDMRGYREIYSKPYRQKRIGIFRAGDGDE